MRYAVEAWAAEYGAPMEDAGVLASPQQPPDLTVEVPVAAWAPQAPSRGIEPARVVLFTDGVRRIDARVWIDDGGTSRLGVCASYGAGIVRAARNEGGDGGRATVVAAEVRRGLFTAASTAEPIVTRHATFCVRAACGDGPEQLTLAVQQRMGELEIELVTRAGDVDGADGAGGGRGGDVAHGADLVVVDGPLRGRQHLSNAIGYVKTHHVAYLPPLVEGVVSALAPGQRTPLFLTSTSWTRYSWYLRLPGGTGHAWAGVVRCEASADLDPAAAVALADMAALTLPRFASAAHKDPRAPQNLYPIAGLERALRHRLGDAGLLYRSLCGAAGGRFAGAGADAAS